MLGFLKKLVSDTKSPSRKQRDWERYEAEKKLSVSKEKSDRLKLAHNPDTHQEILYYLATHDPDPEVRLAVVRNESTPVQASRALARDQSIDVRLALAQRLVTLLPNLDEKKQSELYAFAVRALGTLALDEVLKIRTALASTLKDYAHVPPKVANQLARDVEKEVSEPILRFCLALSDEDLLDILKNHKAAWTALAIANRGAISAIVSQAIIDLDDEPAGVALLENKGALLAVNTLQQIVDKSRDFTKWQSPLALHSGFSTDMARKLAEFADASVRDVLVNRSDFDMKSIDEISAVFKRRLAFAAAEDSGEESTQQHAQRLEKTGKLNDQTITDAIGMRDNDFLFEALAKLTQSTSGEIARIFALKAPKPIIALAWRAGLSMRTALALQQGPAQVQPKELIYPRDGVDYPLTEEEILWQLDFLGISKG